MKRISEWWKKIYDVMKTQSFFVLLFVCIVAVAVTAVYVTTYNRNKLSQEPLSDVQNLDNALKSDNSKIIVTDSQKTEEPKEVSEEVKEDVTKGNAATSQETPEETVQNKAAAPKKSGTSPNIKPVSSQKSSSVQAKNSAWIKPVDGIAGNGFAVDSMVYSETLKQWTTHNGMDIKSEFGNDVVAVADGTVKRVYTDGKLGVTVEMDLGNGITARYSNLDSSVEVEEGQNVKAGDVIGRIGNTALFEIADGDHLHFEVLKDGKNVNPADYVKY
ncbi:MAG: M23 family metallopeptidase [Clostridiales bacterium]|nr:M23 family metallopeptidase [Clostridiales bacterium]